MDRVVERRGAKPPGGRTGDPYGGMRIRKASRLVYDIYTPRGTQVARLLMPDDGQIIRDSVALAYICPKLAVRWRVARGSLGKGGGKGGGSCGGIAYKQVGASAYELYIPEGIGYRIGQVLTPNDGQYVEDEAVLCHVCTALAKRYGLA